MIINEKIKTALKILVSALLLLFIFFVFFLPLEFEDGWWHLATGRWIVQNGAVPHYDPFPFTDKPTPWVFTQWLGSVIFYLVHALSGMTGLKIFRFAIFLLTIFFFIGYNRKKIPFYYLLILTFFLIRGLEGRCLFRPMIFNAAFAQLFLIILLNYEKTHDYKKLLWLIPIGALWSNLHLGSFVYGTILIGIFLFAAVVEYANFLIEKKAICFSKDHLRPIKDLSLTLILFWLSMAISPYGIDAMIYPWKVFIFPSFINIYKAIDIIQEAQSPNVLNPNFIWFYLCLGLTLFSMYISVKKIKNKFSLSLVVIFSIFLLLYANRLSDLASIMLANMLVLAFPRKKDTKAEKLFPLYCSIVILYIIHISAITAYENSFAYLIKDGKKEHKILRNYYANDHKKGSDFLASLDNPNRVFCSDMFGGYLIWRFYPKSKPFVDGRQLDQHIFFERYVKWLDQPVDLWEALDAEYDFQVVFLEMNLKSTLLSRYLLNNPEWELVMIDSEDILFIKKNFEAERQKSSLKMNVNDSKLSVEEQKDFERILKIKIPRYLIKPPEQLIFICEVPEAITFFDLGFYNHAIRMIIDLNKKYKNNFRIAETAKLFNAVLNYMQKIQNTK